MTLGENVVKKILQDKYSKSFVELDDTDYKVGDKVESVGGFFTEGTVTKVEGDILTIHWTKDNRHPEGINLVQVRSKKIVRKL